MRRVTPVILAAAAFLLALDIVGAVTERPLGFPYPTLSVVSFLVYLAVGLLAAGRSFPIELRLLDKEIPAVWRRAGKVDAEDADRRSSSGDAK